MMHAYLVLLSTYAQNRAAFLFLFLSLHLLPLASAYLVNREPTRPPWGNQL